MMERMKFFTVILLVMYSSRKIDGHGMLMEPVNRGSAWRKGFNTPPNYTDNQNYCGGFAVQYVSNNGKCGVCGDNYADPQPRANENGGLYGLGVIVRNYSVGQEIDLHVLITANHIGYFEFSICPLSDPDDVETDECFEQYPIQLSSGSYRYPVPKGVTGYFNTTGFLPQGLICEQCVLRWHYKAGNNWGECEDGTKALGCGNQETFRSCSDISIEQTELDVYTDNTLLSNHI